MASVTDPKPGDNERSPEWPRVREEHLKAQPACMVCGGKDGLNVHHIRPFHIEPELELDPTNLITLGETDCHACHLMVGHLFNFQSYNVNVVADAAEWLAKILNRPSGVNKE